MAAWPELDELKQVLDVTSTEWDGDEDNTRLTRLLAAAIARVKRDVGRWDEDVDEPDDRLAQAALRMAELLAQRPEVTVARRTGTTLPEVATDPTYQRLMFGHRRTFGVA